MKKLFTLLTLALMSIGSAWADDVKVTWTMGDNTTGVATPSSAATSIGYTVGAGLTENGTYSFSDIKFSKFDQNTSSEKGSNSHDNAVSLKKYVDFTFTPVGGNFTPTKVSFDIIKLGTGDPTVFVDVIDGEINTIAVADNKTIRRNNDEDAEISHSYNVNGAVSSDKAVTLRILVGKLASGKSVGIANVVIEGTFVSASAPVFAPSVSSLTLAVNPAVTTKNATFKLTGKNLTDGTYNLTVPSVAGLSVTPTSFTVASGAVDQEFTVSYTSAVDVAAASANITATVNDIVATVAVNYSARLSFAELAAISEATTWDFNNWNEEVKLSDKTDLNYSTRYVYSDIVDVYSLTAPSGFAANKLAFKGEYPVRAKKSQNGVWTFKTTVPGTITVDFSDTGSSGDNPHKRYLKVNDVVTDQYTQRDGSSNKKTSEAINVPAGEVNITAWDYDAVDGESNPIPGGAQIAICLYKIVFTPLAAGNDVVEVGQYKWATRVASNDLDFTGSAVKAYIVTDHTDNALTLTQVNKVASGTPILLNAAKGSYTIPNSFTGDADATTGNKLKAGTGAAVSAESGKTKYVLSAKEGNAVFKKINTNAATVAADKAYLEFDEVISAPELDIVFNGDVTGISATLVNNEKVNSEVYDLQGRKVMNPAKGLYIVNGRKVIIK